jgi:aminopeptidase
MLTERQLENYADVLWWGLETARREPFRRRDIVQIRYQAGAARLAEILYGKLLQKGLHPVPRAFLTTGMERSFYGRAAAHQLEFIPPGEERLARRLNGSIFLNAPESLTHLGEADPRKIVRAAVAARPLRAILEQREALGAYSWTIAVLPTAELARHAGLSLAQYGRQVVRACFLDSDRAVAEWRGIHRRAGRIKQALDALPVAGLHLESAGCDLRLSLGAKRRWAGISGRNIPSFEIFVSPDWRGTQGVFRADLPSFRNGNIVGEVRLEFKAGQVVKAAAERGEAFLRRQLATDAGACRVGEFSLTDRRFSKINRFMASTLYDENFGGAHGNCHIALGAAYANTYAGDPRRLSPAVKERLGFNSSALHWDFINSEPKRVTAALKTGGRVVIYENGEFRI